MALTQELINLTIYFVFDKFQNQVPVLLIQL